MSILDENKIKYSLVVPVYNSEKILPQLIKELQSHLKSIINTLEIIFVDDCSQDESWSVLKQIKLTYPSVRIIRLAKNIGQFAATICGINKAKGLAVITLDDDLQFKTSDIPDLVEFFEANKYLLIYGIPKQRTAKKINSFFTKVALWYLFRFLLEQRREVEAYSSLRIFNKKALLSDQEGHFFKLKSDIDSYCSLHLDSRYIGFFQVEHQKRLTGNSTYSFMQKVNLFFTLNRAYIISPLQLNIYLIMIAFLINLIAFFMFENGIKLNIFLSITNFILISINLMSLIILGFYTTFLYKKINNHQLYLIAEEN